MAAVLLAAGVESTLLEPPGSDFHAEVVRTASMTPTTLATVVVALRQRLRHGITVRVATPSDVVVRCDADVAQGLMVIRGQNGGDTEIGDAASVPGVLGAALVQETDPSIVALPGSYAPSLLFETEQNVALASEAIRMARVFADPDFVHGAQPTRDLLDDPAALTAVAERPRVLLDLLLLAHAFSRTDDGDPEVSQLRLPGMEEARRLASVVEVFVLPSTDPEARVLVRPLPGGGQGFLIGVPPLAAELMANLCWAMPVLFSVADESYGTGGTSPDRERLWSDLDSSVASYLRSWRPGRATTTLLPPQPLIPMTMPPGEIPHGPGDPFMVFDACGLFLIARALAPILSGRLGEQADSSPLPPFTAGLPRAVGREVMADSSGYVLTTNALILDSSERAPCMPDIGNVRRHFHGERPSRFGRTRRLQQQARRDGMLMLRSVDRATEALLSYYAVADIIAALARARGDSALARHLESIADRRETVCAYASWVKQHGFPESWGLCTWREGEEEQWEHFQAYVRHVQQHLVPAIVGG
ncbi:hypothetical protein [Streptomyces cinnamoneus]|uniref:hypothetical protein n=1 Tax=Streptomyces cinnamoneus TaxID=53446 RepID=UPI00167EDE18|nr:hypothetical protein [Streptomyces cinnamoneus]